MKSIYSRLLIACLLLSSAAFAQSTTLRGIYVDGFSQILGNTVKEDSLLHYAQDSSFNYLALYDLHNVSFSNATSVNNLANFIRKARENYGVINIGAVGESYSAFRDKITPYNNARTNANEKFNVFNLEFEFWTTSSVNPGGYYCTQYLQPNNCGCDSAGGFKYYIKQMHLIDSIASVQGAISETYVGWFNQGQAQQIVSNTDRVLLHAYRINPSSVYGYSQTRLSYLASLHQPVDVMPIFSSEPNFMGPWLASHSNTESYTKYAADFTADGSSWKSYIRLQGYHWFDYGYMPHPVYTGTTTTAPVVTASGPLSFCSGGNVTLTAPANATYLWTNGMTTRTIVVSTAGNYSCSVTQNGTTQSSNVLSVYVNAMPSSSFAIGTAGASGVPLTSTSSAGSGSISSYRWYHDGASISGATSSSYMAIQDGSYTVQVTNSNGCSQLANAQSITVPVVSCILTAPTGLGSAAVSTTTAMVSWSTLPQTDSVIVRYKKEGTNTYYYLRMPNTGQNSILLTNLAPNSRYSWRVKTMCGNTASSYSAKAYFGTGTSSNYTSNNSHGRTIFQEVDAQNDDDEILAYPVPANEFIQFYFFADNEQNGEISIVDISGRIVRSSATQLIEGDNTLRLHTEDILPGIYFASVKTDGIVLTKRIMIHH
ncbi:MAG: T9SS type A sorting domain-containing protein [Bacteroidetes bacterium]|nr:T9SS type A sorting domain-containing protein [Bacteroidota bacterium]